MQPKVNRPLSATTQILLGLPQDQREALFKQIETDFDGVSMTDDVGSEIQKSAGQLSMGPVLFDRKVKNFVVIDFGKKTPDYVYHISFSKKKPSMSSADVINIIAKTTCEIKPDSIEAILKPPTVIPMDKEVYEIDCYTLIVKKVCNLPGSRKIMEEVLVSALLDNLDDFYKKS